MLDEFYAGAGRRDNTTLRIRKDVDPLPRHFPALPLESAVEKGLAAAGLAFRKATLDTETFQQKNHLPEDIGKQIFSKAGNKQLRFHSLSLFLVRFSP
jgi:hypothetical protein